MRLLCDEVSVPLLWSVPTISALPDHVVLPALPLAEKDSPSPSLGTKMGSLAMAWWAGVSTYL